MSCHNKDIKRNDILYIKSLLRESGIEEYDPNVVNQLLSAMYNRVSNILEDAIEFSRHANKENIDVSDVNLAINYQGDAKPLSRNELIEIANDRNLNPLPNIEPRDGLKLPSKHCLTETNCELKHKKQCIQDSAKPTNCDTYTQPANPANSTTFLRKYICQPTQPTILTRPIPRFVINMGNTSTVIKKP